MKAENTLVLEIAKRIRAERDRKGVTREVMAEAVGISVSFLADLEYGKSGPGLDNLVAIAQYLGVSTDYLLGVERPDDFCHITRHMRNLQPEALRTLEAVVKAYAENQA